jgi:hypothetical protein
MPEGAADSQSAWFIPPSLGKDENTRLAVIRAVVVNARYRWRALVQLKTVPPAIAAAPSFLGQDAGAKSAKGR